MSNNESVQDKKSETNSYTPEQLQNICDKLENLPKINQVEVLRIFYNSNKDLINENKYGIHINMTDVEDSTLNEMIQYLDFVSKQENELVMIEQQQNTNNNYVIKDNKEMIDSNLSTSINA